MLLLTGIVAMTPAKGHALGSWTAIANFPYSSPGHMLLLTDGTVMVQNGAGSSATSNWYALKPDINGNYLNGNWSRLPSMTDARGFYASQVLQNGKVLVAGGEDGTGGAHAELFDPQANGGIGSWSDATPPASPQLLGAFSDSGSILLSDGTFMVTPVAVYDQNVTNLYNTLIYNPATGSWGTGNGGSIQYQDEASWVKLPDDSILSANIFTGGTTSERYIPGAKVWIADAGLPIPVEGGSGEVGGAFLMADGRAFWLGGSGHTAYYTPTGNTNTGNWSQGPDMPSFNGTLYNWTGSNYAAVGYNGILSAQDTPAAMMNNGKILCQLAANTYHSEVWFYEFDPSTSNFVAAPSPTNATPGAPFLPAYTLCDGTSMLDLPDGNVLYNDTGGLYIYTPDGSPLASGKPSIQSVFWNADGSLHLTGTLFNGTCQGASYGDDAQMDSNYPLVRFVDASLHATYGRTYNWSSTGVQTGGKIVATECAIPASLSNGPGTYSVQVVANGIASDAVTLDVPVWVDFNYASSPQLGTYANPFNTLAAGVSAVPTGGAILIKPGTSAEQLTISKAMTISAVGGSASIGN